FAYSINNLDDLEYAVRDASDKFSRLHLLARAIWYLKAASSEEKISPQIDEDRLLQTYYKIRRSLGVDAGSSFLELDPFQRQLIQAVDFSDPCASTIVIRIIVFDLVFGPRNRHWLPSSLDVKELMDQGVTSSDLDLAVVLDLLWWYLRSLFWANLVTILKDFDLGPDWLMPMFIYAVTGKMLGVPPLDIESKTPLFVPSEYHEAVEAYVNFVRTNHNKRINVIGRFSTPLSQKKEIIPLKLPPNTKWKDITIKFLDGHNVRITAPNVRTEVGYKEMGFQDDKRRMPNKQWKLLQLLAEKHGELSWLDREATTLIKKKKQLLSDTLKARFQINEDPFFPYKKVKAYKIKMNLIPE
ncbi:unnamed protein product, partial [marine sediment metagenome]